MGKVLTEVRSPQRSLIPDTVDWELYEQPFLWGIANKAKEISLLTTKASTTEEPREGKLHAGICAGGAEKSAFLPCRAPSEAWCILQGERPCRERINYPPVSSVAPTAELKLINF